jgi:glycosyltransferase involved in cell wall biosynthesis
VSSPVITFLSHTARPGGGELALRRYLIRTGLPVRLVTMAAGEVWEDLPCPVTVAPSLQGVTRTLREDDGPVVANSMRAALYARLVGPRRRPLVYWVRDGLTDSAMSRSALRLTRRVTASGVHSYLANSEWTAGTVRDALRADPARVSVVQSVCGVGPGRSARPRTAPRSPVRLLFLGRLAPWKAPDVAVAALTTLRAQGLDATLSLAGDAHFGEHRYTVHLARLAARTGGVTMLGHVEDVPALLADHDLTMHCSLVPEPFGQVVVQSLAAGVPAVATLGGGPSEILRGAPVDVTYQGGDPGELAKAVRRALASYERLSAWALERAGHYADDTAAAGTDAVLGRLLNQPDTRTTSSRTRP